MTIFIFDDLHDVRLTYKQTIEYFKHEPYLQNERFSILDDHRSTRLRIRYFVSIAHAPHAPLDPSHAKCSKIKAMRFFRRLKKRAYSYNKNKSCADV